MQHVGKVHVSSEAEAYPPLKWAKMGGAPTPKWDPIGVDPCFIRRVWTCRGLGGEQENEDWRLAGETAAGILKDLDGAVSLVCVDGVKAVLRTADQGKKWGLINIPFGHQMTMGNFSHVGNIESFSGFLINGHAM